MTIAVKETLSHDDNVNSVNIIKFSTNLKFQCCKRSGLKFSSLETCKARRTRAKEHPDYINLSECVDCSGPIPLEDAGEDSLISPGDASRRTEEFSAEQEMCKCGRGPVVIRKNGVSAGRCRQCMSDVAKTWPRGRKQSTMKDQNNSKDTTTSLDANVLVALLKERKEEAEHLINNVIGNGSLNGDKDISQAIISFVRLTATIDVLLKAEILVNIAKPD